MSSERERGSVSRREGRQTSSAPLSAPTARVFPSLVAVQRLLFSYPLESVSCIMNIIICLYFEMTNSDITAATMCNTALWLAGWSPLLLSFFWHQAPRLTGSYEHIHHYRLPASRHTHIHYMFLACARANCNICRARRKQMRFVWIVRRGHKMRDDYNTCFGCVCASAYIGLVHAARRPD
jgi:hypothetical protein